MAPRCAVDFASQLSPDRSAVLVQRDPATFLILQLPSLKVTLAQDLCSSELQIGADTAVLAPKPSPYPCKTIEASQVQSWK